MAKDDGRMIRGFVLGIVVAAALVLAAGYIAIVDGMVPANADGKPGAFERWAARTSLRATLRREAGRAHNPLVPAMQA
ncbi:MAG: hypothetical protein ABI182_08665 [Candidatus Baltobacteraceae bacterium]